MTMTKAERVRRLTGERTEPARRAVRSEAEVQQALMHCLAEMTRLLQGLSRQQIEASQQSERTQRNLERFAGQAAEAARKIQSVGENLQWTTVAGAALTGWIAGVATLLALELRQPEVLKNLWHLAMMIRQ